MKCAWMLGVVVVLAGCGQMGGSNTTVFGQLSNNSAVEEFEGTIELFGTKVKARRQVKLNADGNYVKHGRAVAWYENGQKAGEMAFQDDKPHGKELSWHENGMKRLNGESKEGLATGHWTEWYDNGQRQSEGDYLEGERHGAWTFWEPTGTVIETVEYRGGRKLGVAQNNSSRPIR